MAGVVTATVETPSGKEVWKNVWDWLMGSTRELSETVTGKVSESYSIPDSSTKILQIIFSIGLIWLGATIIKKLEKPVFGIVFVLVGSIILLSLFSGGV